MRSNPTGTFDDFKTDVDRVDVSSIQVSADGRAVVFVKDGARQRVFDSDDTKSKIVKYLKGLHEIAGGDENRAREMNRLFRGTDDYNDLDKVKAYMDPAKPRTWADKFPPEDSTSNIGDGNAGDFKEDMDRVDAASIRMVNERVYFMKDGRWHHIDNGDHLGGGYRDIYNQLVMIANMTKNGKNLKLAARIDQIWDRTDDYNEAVKLEEYLKKIGAL